MLHLFLTTVFAAPPAGYEELKQGNDCTVYRGAQDAAGIAPVYAECVWPEIPPDKLHKVLIDWEGHADTHVTVATSKIEKTEGERSLVYQVHQLSGISDREVRIWMQRTAVPNGFEYSWKNIEPFEPLVKGNVATTKHEGYWRVTANPAGGSKVEYALTYNPGGSVPGFLIRWFQAGGTIDTTVELRTAGNK
jgi:hypothetical protein